MKRILFPAALILAAAVGFSANQKMRHNAKQEIEKSAKQVENMGNIKTITPAPERDEAAEKAKEEKIVNDARTRTQTTLKAMTLEIAKGEKCTENCEDMAAGFEWAKSQDFNEESDCGGKTQAYKDGCQIYVDKYDSLFDQNKELLEAEAEATPNPAPPTNQVQ